MTSNCVDCNANIGQGSCLFFPSSKSLNCAACNKSICAKCANDQALIPYTSNEDGEPLPIQKSSIKCHCKSCYQSVSTLDYSRTYDIIEPAADEADENTNTTTTLLWVHGGGSCRKMFMPHAKYLSKQGYRSILIDLPGHGTLVDTKLTLDECVATVQSILDKECTSSQKIVYIGGSLGAYIGFYILGKLNKQFSSAVLIDCGQNVGPDCSLKARFGIWFLRKLSTNMSNKALMGAMMGAVKKSKADYHLVETTFGAGYFFQQGGAQCDCMHTVAPADIVPSLDFPVLFFNGSEDYRDCEDKWLALCKHKELSTLKVYEGGDHFFCHDTRFVHDMLERVDRFIQAVFSADTTS
jgi:pimeloyl-ACP methyl ester carboxylesterase